jgi:Tfp pilus assembly protein PilO
LPGVPVHLPLETINGAKGKLTKGFIKETKERNRAQSDIYRDKLKNSRIINVFLVVLILAMFAVVIFGDNSPLKDAEKKIQDKYATWEEQLKEREQSVEEREQQLNSKE